MATYRDDALAEDGSAARMLDPRVKCSLWRWAITRTGVSALEASYMEVLDEHIVTYIIQLASWGVVQGKRKMAWANLHIEYLL